MHDLLSYIATGPHSGHAAPETSALAAEKFKAKHGSIRQVVHDRGRGFGAAGFTDEDLAPPNLARQVFERSYRPRRTELANERWFLDSGRRVEVGGSKCVVWVHRDFADNPPPLQEQGRPTPKNERIAQLEAQLAAVREAIARRSVPTMDATWSAAYNAALDTVAKALAT